MDKLKSADEKQMELDEKNKDDINKLNLDIGEKNDRISELENEIKMNLKFESEIYFKRYDDMNQFLYKCLSDLKSQSTSNYI